MIFFALMIFVHPTGNILNIDAIWESRLHFGIFTTSMDDDLINLLQKQQTEADDIVIGSETKYFKHFEGNRKVMGGPSLHHLQKAIELADSSPYKISIIAYDIEHWELTPIDEQNNPVGSISKGASIVHSAGYKFGIAPDLRYLLDNYQKINWKEVDFLVMQMQRKAADTQYLASTVESVTKVVRSMNPETEIFVQVALRFTDVEQTMAAIERARYFADGIIIVYIPSGFVPCPNCTLENLETVLVSINSMRLHSSSKTDIPITENDQTNQKIKIPDWVRNNAKWWSEGSIGDNHFALGIQYMIKTEIIKIPITENDQTNQKIKIPDWVRNNAKWWSEGSIGDNEFALGIQYLIKIGIILV